MFFNQLIAVQFIGLTVVGDVVVVPAIAIHRQFHAMNVVLLQESEAQIAILVQQK
jgi:hypothetical protein